MFSSLLQSAAIDNTPITLTDMISHADRINKIVPSREELAAEIEPLLRQGLLTEVTPGKYLPGGTSFGAKTHIGVSAELYAQALAAYREMMIRAAKAAE